MPKAASTSWMAYFLKQSKKPANIFLKLSDAWNAGGMDGFNSFITVRHPFERLLSAYRDRFFAMDNSARELKKEELFRRSYGLDIIRKHRYVTDNQCNGKF